MIFSAKQNGRLPSGLVICQNGKTDERTWTKEYNLERHMSSTERFAQSRDIVHIIQMSCGTLCNIYIFFNSIVKLTIRYSLVRTILCYAYAIIATIKAEAQTFT